MWKEENNTLYKKFEFKDLEKVVYTHSQNIESAMLGESPLVIIDTDIHITKSYAKFVFKKELKVQDRQAIANKGRLYFYLNK